MEYNAAIKKDEVNLLKYADMEWSPRLVKWKEQAVE